jgi:hypothetical protein
MVAGAIDEIDPNLGIAGQCQGLFSSSPDGANQPV